MNRKSLVLALLGLIACVQQTLAQKTDKPKATLNHTAIYVVDLQRSSFFYEQIIGLDTVPEPFHDGKHTWLQIAPHSMMHIIQGADAPKTYFKNQHTCFSVPSVEAFTEKLKQHGIGWEDRDGKQNAITIRIDGIKQLWLRDPDGYWIEINDDKY